MLWWIKCPLEFQIPFSKWSTWREEPFLSLRDEEETEKVVEETTRKWTSWWWFYFTACAHRGSFLSRELLSLSLSLPPRKERTKLELWSLESFVLISIFWIKFENSSDSLLNRSFRFSRIIFHRPLPFIYYGLCFSEHLYWLYTSSKSIYEVWSWNKGIKWTRNVFNTL